MKIQTLGWLLGAVALASAGSIVACSQAAVQCTVGHAGATVNLPNGLVNGYSAKYTVKGTAAACVEEGDIVGFESYHPPGGGDDGLQPDFSKPTIMALQASSLENLVRAKKKKAAIDENVDHKSYSVGPFSTVEPDTSAICVVPTLVPAQKDIPKVDAVAGMGGGDPGKPEEPATSLKYEWTNIKMYVTAAVPGTQFTADLHYTKDACVVDYQVIGSWPAVPCGDADDKPSDALCCPEADPNGGRPTGSGINPDFPMKCDPGLLRCVLDTPDATTLPVLKPGWASNADGVPTGVCKLTPAGGSTSTGM